MVYSHNHSGFHFKYNIPWASQVALVVKNLPVNAGDAGVRFLDQKDPLEEGMATHSSILARRIPMDRGAW